MARDSMDILELLRKRGMDGDVDFLREALAVLVEGIMDAEVSAKGRSRLRRAQSGSGVPAQRIPQQGLGHASGHDGVAHTEAEGRELLPESAGAAASEREGAAGGDTAGVCGGRVHEES